MNLGRRMQLLTCHASRNIPQQRRHEILAELLAWLDSEFCSAVGEEEKFWLLMAGAGTHMEPYMEQVQAEEGGKIIEKELAGK